MDYPLFEQRCLEVLYKTDAILTPAFAAYRVGCTVEQAQAHLDAMASRGVLELDVGDDGAIAYNLRGRPAPSGEPLSWGQSAPAPSMQPPTTISPVPPAMPAPYAMPVNIQVNNAPAIVVLGAEKSVVGAVLLALFFGPLGLLYATGLGALVMFLCYLVFIPVTLGLAFPLLAIGCAVWGGIAAAQHNARINAPFVALSPRR